MKVGILTESVSSHSGARAPLEIAKHLVKLGNQITVYGYGQIQDLKTIADLRKNDVEVKIIAVNNTPVVGKYIAAFSLYKMLHKNPPQVFTFSATHPFFFAALITGIPIIKMYHGTQFGAYLEKFAPDQRIDFLSGLVNKIVNIYIYLSDLASFRLSKAVVSISKFATDEGEYLYKRKVETFIYLGATKLKGFLKKKNNKRYFSLVSVSRITPYKGFHLIIDALKKVDVDKRYIFTIVGSQPKNSYLKYLKQIGGENVEIVINPSDAKLANIYKNADLYLNADRYLYFGLPIYEAGLFKIPAISFNLAAASEIIEHEKSGFIAKNVDDFAKYLKIMIEDNRLRKKLGLNAYKKAKKYSWDYCASNWEKVLKKFAAK